MDGLENIDVEITNVRVDQIRLDNAFTLCLSNGARIRIATGFRIGNPADSMVTADPEVSHDYAPTAADLLRTQVTVTVGRDDSILRVRSEAGDLGLDVGPHPDYESWEIVDYDGSMVICLPVGGTTRFGPNA